jgi:hypothetical protein
LKLLLDLSAEGTSLDGNDLRCGLRVVCNWGATFGAEDAVDWLA